MSSKRDQNWLVVVIIVIVAVVLLGPLSWMGGFGMMGPWMMGFGFGWPFMFLFPLVFIVLIVLGLYYLLSGQEGFSGPRGRGENEALPTLKERYARGELTSEQYAKMKKDLES